MCFNKQKTTPAAVLPAAATPVAQPVSSSANVRSAVKDPKRDSNADLRSDVTQDTPVTTVPTDNAGDVSLGAKKKRKGVVGLDL
jgi:hypothetical protein